MKRLLATILLSLLIFTSLSYANVAFNDISSSYWAYDYIRFTAEKEIINGFPDGTFLPANPVTKEQSLTMIYRSLKAADMLKSDDDYTKAYLSIMEENQIAQWAQSFVAYALEYEIISEKDLSTFVQNGVGTPASREEVAVWSAKAVNKALSPLYVLNYSDRDHISKEAMPYIDLMYRQKIMMGDDNNRFRSESTITRAEFAAVCSRVYHLSEAESFNLEKEGYTLSGTVKDTKSNEIILEDSEGKQTTLMISENAGIIINGEERKSLRSLDGKEKVIIAYNNVVDQNHIIIWSQEGIQQGTIKETRILGNDTYKVTIENDDNQSISYILNNESEVYDRNNSKISTSDLTFGDKVKYTCDGIKILEVKIQ